MCPTQIKVFLVQESWVKRWKAPPFGMFRFITHHGLDLVGLSSVFGLGSLGARALRSFALDGARGEP